MYATYEVGAEIAVPDTQQLWNRANGSCSPTLLAAGAYRMFAARPVPLDTTTYERRTLP